MRLYTHDQISWTCELKYVENNSSLILSQSYKQIGSGMRLIFLRYAAHFSLFNLIFFHNKNSDHFQLDSK